MLSSPQKMCPVKITMATVGVMSLLNVYRAAPGLDSMTSSLQSLQFDSNTLYASPILGCMHLWPEI